MDASEEQGLSLEQQFKLEVLKKEIDGLNKEQAREYLLQIFRQMMLHENLCREMLKQCYL
ncbi:Phycobilisome degradation protein nblA [Stanieria cyanosphaera PCC 7437]|uniref:Phycobilisome degradation protein nblA n=1 Tax=Stanieria cyanosphaera (strain ATCC 29371 / PCC 7437) TaxID=111780 RepID=K9XYQ0_STAC7|nr:NblA/ycf18 family protein [Stanieria cyanosphaera]AFZ37730.1 Phycobilisome degradation protein nblA [Stanieria cyanosphaera PCC 7437]